MHVEKPWGHENIWAVTDKYVGKILFIKDGHKLSLQYHKIKKETIMVQSGLLTLEIGDAVLFMRQGDVCHIDPGTIHRMIAEHGDVSVIEVSTPELDDVVRLKDDYARS